MFRRLVSVAVIAACGWFAYQSGMLERAVDAVSSEVEARSAAGGGSQAARSSVSANDKKAARAQLNGLRVSAAASMAGYNRNSFPHWRDPDGNGCDARKDTLVRDRSKGAVGVKCAINGGRWIDPYGGKVFTSSRSLDIDHIVPLANAWRSGATRWTRDQRAAFANDPVNLLAVSASLNRSKGDKGPEAWLPPATAYRARYAVMWVNVKGKYGLSVTPAEKSRLAALLK